MQLYTLVKIRYHNLLERQIFHSKLSLTWCWRLSFWPDEESSSYGDRCFHRVSQLGSRLWSPSIVIPWKRLTLAPDSSCAAMLCFYAYVVISGVNPPLKKLEVRCCCFVMMSMHLPNLFGATCQGFQLLDVFSKRYIHVSIKFSSKHINREASYPHYKT